MVKITGATQSFRFLISKLVFGLEDQFTEEDKVCLFSAWEKLVILCHSEQDARVAHGHYVNLTRCIIQSLDDLSRNRELRKKAQEDLLPFLSHGRGYFSPQIYFGLKKQAAMLYQAFLKHRFPQVFPQEKYVGVGYGDKGTARDEARDGSPHWWDVALDERKETREERYSKGQSKSEPNWSSYAVHHLQRYKIVKGTKTEEEIPLKVSGESRKRIFGNRENQQFFLAEIATNLD